MARWGPLWVASAAQLMLVLDVSVVNVALPQLQTELAVDGSAVQWVASAYALVFASGLLVGGRAADVFGLRAVFTAGLAVFVVASVVGGLAASAALLIGARAAQGAGAALASPATFTVLTRYYREGPERARAVAVWTAVSLVGGGVGNLVGGLLTDLVSWRAVLLINLPVGAAVCTAALVVIKPQRLGRRPRVDVLGVVMTAGAMLGVTLAVSRAGSSTTSTTVWTVLAAAAVAAVVVQQRSSAAPLIPARLWRNRTVIGANALTLLTGACFQAPIWLFLTYTMQRDMGFTPTEAGLGFLPLTLVTMLVGVLIAPKVLDRWPPGPVIATAAVIAAGGFTWQALAPTADYLLAIAGPAVVIGVGAGLLNTPLAVAVTSNVADADAGAASGLMNTGKQLGGALGLAALTPVTAGYTSFTTAFSVMATLMVLVAIGATRLTPKQPSTHH